jgi:RHS repeat-associated protein
MITHAAAALLAAALALPAAAADKSSSRPGVISVPRGPGSIEGLGESFEANLNAGSVRETVPIALPPGTNGLAPSLALAYDSGFGNGPLGIGWSLGVSTVQVQTEKGLPRYDGTDRFLLDGAELVPVGGGVYRLKHEGRFVRVRRAGDGWQVDAPDGRTLRYGLSAEARVEAPRAGGATATFSWALEEVVDLFGNRIVYSYVKDRGQSYLAAIAYNVRPGAAENRVDLEYEPRPDPLTDYRPRFAVTTAQRLRRISVFGQKRLVRRYVLDYDEATGVSLLASVRQVGTDDRTALPPVRFWYSPFTPQTAARAMTELPPSLPRPGDGNDELVDVDGDGFVDILHAESGSHWYAANQGGTRFAAPVEMPSAPTVSLSAKGVEVLDHDGDGLPDLVARLGLTNDEWHVFANRGRGRWEGEVVLASHPPFGLEEPNVRVLDFDHDKLPDVVQSTGSGLTLWRNKGDGTYEGPFAATLPPGGQGLGFADPHLRLADMNGDRLLDLVYVLDGSVTYWPSLGWGSFGDAITVANAPAPGPTAEADLLLADVNGDGLTDLVWVAPDHVDVWPLLPGDSYGALIRVREAPYRDPGATAIRLADMNGNGTTDIVWSTPSAAGPERLVYLDLVGDVRPNLLVGVENGIGKRLELAYTTTGAEYQRARAEGTPWSTRVPFAVQVLARTRLMDGLGDVHETSYAYRDGWYAAESREFRGFARAVRTERGDASEATSVSIHDFDLGRDFEVLKGSPVAVEHRTESGTVLQRERTGWDPALLLTGTDGVAIRQARRVWQEVEHVEGTTSPVVTRDDLRYDEYGNVTVHSEWGIVEGDDRLARNDERITTTAYLNDPSSWLLGRAWRVVVTDAYGKRSSETRTYFDGPAFVGLAAGVLGPRGLPTRVERWVERERFAQTSRVERDEFGNVVATLDPEGARRDFEYDASTHRYPVRELWRVDATHALEFRADYDLALGTLTTYRDPGGAETGFAYDALLRLTAISRPGDPDGKPTASFEYVFGNPLSKVVTRSRVEVGADAVVERHAWYDGQGRQLALVEDAGGGRTVVTGMRQLGLQGRVIREHEPFYSRGFDLPVAATTPHTSHVYDALGRRVRSILPDGSTSELRHAPMAVESWDAEDLDSTSLHYATPRTERMDGRGLVEVEERLGARRLVTRYARDVAGRVTSVVDADGHEATYVHDGLGRVIESSHPDAGRTVFVLDDAGNLVERHDARGARVVARYDGAGRPLEEHLVSATDVEEEVVRYHYDDPSPLFPGDVAAGELAWVEDGAGEEHYRRDARGRLVETVRRIDGVTYRLAQRLDAQDRVTGITYPDGRELEYRYDPRGQLRSVPGVIDEVEHDARGRAVRMVHAGGALSTAAYDELDRTSALETSAGGRKLQSLSYRYDRVGSLREIVDGLRATGPLSASRSYTFDDLYRLVSAEGAGRSWTYAHHDDGRFRATSTAGEYTYGAGHRATGVGGKVYQFDAAGNLVERPGSTLEYDARGRVRRITKADGTVVRFRYDYSGARTVKESEGPGVKHRTVYVDRVAEERDGELVDYVFAGDRRVARLGGKRPAPVAAGALRWLGGLPGALAALAALALAAALASQLTRAARRRARPAVALATAFAFLSVTTAGCGGAGSSSPPPAPLAAVHYHGDHLGGVALQTDERGQVLAEQAYDPYGGSLAASTEPYGFTGKELDPETGLYEFGARLYDPAIGLFLSPDPAVLGDPELAHSDPQLLQPYAYTRNSPTSHVDPDGRFMHIAAGALAGALIGGGIYLAKAAITGEGSARGFAAAAAGGAVAGALAAATGGASLAAQGTVTAAAGAAQVTTGAALAGVAGGMTQRAIETGSLAAATDPRAMAWDAAAGVAGLGAAKVAATVIRKAAPAVKAGLARAGHALQSGAAATKSATNSGGGSITRLWRAVEPEELADVRRYGDYNIHPNSTFKRFAFSEADVDAFIKANPGRSYTKTCIDLPTEKLRFMTEHGDPGGVGRATGIDVYETPDFYNWVIGGTKVVQ